MSRKFKEDDINLVYRCISSEKMRRKQVSILLNRPPEEIDQLYNAAVKKQRRLNSVKKHVEARKLLRQKGVYSNKSYL